VFIRKRQGTASTFLAMATPPMSTAGAWHTIKLQIVGSTLTMFLDGVQMLTATDATFTAGSIAVGSFNMPAEFDDVRVTAP
jgi:pectate lyase